MKLGVVTYVPPTGVLNSDAFYQNLQKFPAKNPLYLMSDSADRNPSRLIKNPELIGKRPHWGLNNLLWFEALSLAKDVGLSYMIYIESDSRVGRAAWDAVMYDEFFKRYPDGICCAGTPVAWDINAGGREFAMCVIDEAHRYQTASGLPASFYSSKDPHDKSGGCYYPNGSLMIVEVAAMLKIFEGFWIDCANYAKRLTAFDMALGKFLWNYHGKNAWKHVGWLACSYSGFGNAVLSEKERCDLLVSGSKVAAHQFKSDWTP